MIDLFQMLWKLPVLKDQFIILMIIRSNMLKWCLTTVDGSGSDPHTVGLNSFMILLTSSVDSSLQTSSLWFEEFNGGVNNS